MHVYDLESEDSILEFHACSHNVTDVGFLHGDRFVAWASPAFRSGLFEVHSGRRIQDFPFGDKTSLSPERSLMVTGGRFIDLARLADFDELGSPGHVMEPLSPESPSEVSQAVQQELRRLDRPGSVREMWRSGDLVAYTTHGGHLLVDRPDTDSVELFTSDYRITVALTFLPQSRRLLRLGQSGNGMMGVVEVFDLEMGDKWEKLMLHPPRHLALSPDERLAAVVDGVGQVWLFSTDDLEHPARLLERSGEPREVRFSPDGEVLAVLTGDRWRKLDIRLLEQQELPDETRYGFRIEGVELYSDRF